LKDAVYSVSETYTGGHGAKTVEQLGFTAPEGKQFLGWSYSETIGPNTTIVWHTSDLQGYGSPWWGDRQVRISPPHNEENTLPLYAVWGTAFPKLIFHINKDGSNETAELPLLAATNYPFGGHLYFGGGLENDIPYLEDLFPSYADEKDYFVGWSGLQDARNTSNPDRYGYEMFIYEGELFEQGFGYRSRVLSSGKMLGEDLNYHVYGVWDSTADMTAKTVVFDPAFHEEYYYTWMDNEDIDEDVREHLVTWSVSSESLTTMFAAGILLRLTPLLIV